MQLDQLIQMWKDDSRIDITDLPKECQRFYDLHAKYLDLWSHERLKMKSLEMEIKCLKLAKHEFYIQGPTKETKDWDYPVSGKILRSDVNIYLDADKHLQDRQKALEISITKFETLQMIIDVLKYRTNVLNGLMKREAWMAGQ